MPPEQLILTVLREAGRPMQIEEITRRANQCFECHFSRFEVLTILDACRQRERVEKQAPDLWRLIPTRALHPLPQTSAQQIEAPTGNRTQKSLLRLHGWQQGAVQRWKAAGRKGIVEAVTGSGKTHVALAAWWETDTEEKPLNTLVVVPSAPLLHQWVKQFRDIFPGLAVGLIGDGYHDNFSNRRICVGTIQSVYDRLDSLLGHTLGPRPLVKSMLVADECHRYIYGPSFRRIRQFRFHYALALSATIDEFEVPGFGQIVETFTFANAVAAGLIPRFDLVNCAVQLTGGEQQKYDELSDALGDQLECVRNRFHEQLNGVGGDAFFRKLQSINSESVNETGSEEPEIKRLFGLIYKRKAIVYLAAQKLELADRITRHLLIEAKRKIIVFFERVHSAEDAADRLDREFADGLHRLMQKNAAGWCRVLHGGHNRNERQELLATFRATRPAALLACRVLDEGIDIPEIDAAILVASTQTERQRVQRIGRALRKGDGTRPLIVTLYAEGTSDQNVVSNDDELFCGAATIYRERAATVLDRVHKLVGV